MALNVTDNRKLGEALERLYERYNWKRYVNPDPLVFLYDYEDPRDREIVALIASSLAFGGVKQIMASVETVLRPMGDSPHRFLAGTGPKKLEKVLGRFRHRWASFADLEIILAGAKEVSRKYGSLENCFASGYSGEDGDIVPALTRFVDEMISCPANGYACLMPSPYRKSACKRLNLFLRWMVRRDRVDPGGWKLIPASSLIVPLDVHMHRFARLMGITERKQAGLGTAREITSWFRTISPDDPVKYDFALTRLGIRRDADRDDMMRMLGVGG